MRDAGKMTGSGLSGSVTAATPASVAVASTAARRRRAFPWIAGILIVAVLLTLIPTAAGYLASRMLANASPPTGVEFPPTPAPQLASSAETSALLGQGRGLNCSIPWAVQQVAFSNRGDLAGPSARYRQACVAHDLCYRHGAATYGYTQADCDQMLMRSSFRMCKKSEDQRRLRDTPPQSAIKGKEEDDKAYKLCVNEARMVFFGVFLGGATAYRPVEPSDGGAIAASEGSGPAEYEPFPNGGASYSVARLAISGDASSLLLFRRSAGGNKYIRRDWTGTRFSDGVSASLPSRWADQPAPPFVAGGFEGRPDMLVWWRRSIGANLPTNGSFATASVAAFSGSSINRLDTASENMDPGSSQFFAVPGRSPDGRLHLIGVTEFPGDWSGCGTNTRHIQLVHVTLDVHHIAQAPFYRCKIHEVFRTSNRLQQTEHVGSYLGEPPALAYSGNAIQVTIFRRDGERRPSEYRDILSGLTVQIPLDDRGDRRPVPSRSCWRIAESEEPFFVPAGPAGLLATLTFSGPNGAVDPDKDWSAPLFLRTIAAGSSKDGCTSNHQAWRLPIQARAYLRSRIVHVRTDNSAELQLSGATDALVMTRIFEVGQTLRASALVVSLNSGQVVGCTQSFFDLPGSLTKEPGEVLRRAARLQPIVGDLDRNGVPDLVFADISGGASFGFIGSDGGLGRLSFAPPGQRGSRNGKVQCEREGDPTSKTRA